MNTPRMKAPRVEGIDLARGLASAIMIQGHAYDGWVNAEGKATASYLFTRVLGTLPLPSFLVLAGAAIALRCEAAVASGEDPTSVRHGLAKRGLTVMAAGYAVNVVSALIDGFEGLETFFRADVLQLIGLTIAFFSMTAIRASREGTLDKRWLTIGAALLAVVPVALCTWISARAAQVPLPLGYALAPFIAIPSVSVMPAIPLASWAGVGVLVGLLLIHLNREARDIAGAPRRVFAIMLVVSLAIVLSFTRLTTLWVEASGEPLSRMHPAVIANAIELAARGVVILSLGGLLSPVLPERVRRILLRLGRGSLVAYVFHVPFCYGAFGRPIQGQLSMLEATFFVALLEVASFSAVWVRDAWKARRSKPISQPNRAS